MHFILLTVIEGCLKMGNEISCICMRTISVCTCNRAEEIEQKEKRKCVCGRSPNGECMSWHALSEKVYIQRKHEYEKSLG